MSSSGDDRYALGMTEGVALSGESRFALGIWAPTQSKLCLRHYPECACARPYLEKALLTVLPKVRHCEGFSPWQSLGYPVCHSEQSEESPTRLYAVNVLSLVGFEEIPRFTRDDHGCQR